MATQAPSSNSAQLRKGRQGALERPAQGAPLEEVLALLVSAIEAERSGMLGSVLLLNQAMRSPGKEDFALIDEKCHIHFHSQDTQVDDCPHMHMLDKKRVCSDELYEPLRGGDFLVTASPICSASGEVHQFCTGGS